MTFIANIIFDLSIIVAIAAFYSESRGRVRLLVSMLEAHALMIEKLKARKKNKENGLEAKAIVKASVATKTAERAFSLASSANIACMALQRTLSVRPTWVSKQQMLKNEVAQKEVEEVIGGKKMTGDMSDFEWLYPVLNDEERQIVDNAIEHNAKFNEGLSNGTPSFDKAIK